MKFDAGVGTEVPNFSASEFLLGQIEGRTGLFQTVSNAVERALNRNDVADRLRSGADAWDALVSPDLEKLLGNEWFAVVDPWVNLLLDATLSRAKAAGAAAGSFQETLCGVLSEAGNGVSRFEKKFLETSAVVEEVGERIEGALRQADDAVTSAITIVESKEVEPGKTRRTVVSEIAKRVVRESGPDASPLVKALAGNVAPGLVDELVDQHLAETIEPTLAEIETNLRDVHRDLDGFIREWGEGRGVFRSGLERAQGALALAGRFHRDAMNALCVEFRAEVRPVMEALSDRARLKSRMRRILLSELLKGVFSKEVHLLLRQYLLTDRKLFRGALEELFQQVHATIVGLALGPLREWGLRDLGTPLGVIHGTLKLSGEVGFCPVCEDITRTLPWAVEAENHFLSEGGNPVRQVLRLQWEVVGDDGPRAERFEVYRGTGELPQVSGENVLTQGARVGVVDWDGVSSRIEWSDGSLDPASDPSKIGKGYWYAIRSVRDAACGRIASAFTPPVFVNVRQYLAPDAPTGSLGINCPRVGLRRAEAGFVREPLDAVSPLESKYRVIVRRRDAGVSWVEVTLRVEAAGVEPRLLESPRLRYGEGDERVVYDVALPRGMGPEGRLVGQVVAGSFAGAISEPLAIHWVGEPDEDERWAIPCEAASVTLSELPGAGPWEGLGAVGPFALADAARAGGGMVVATSPDSGATVLVEARAAGATEAEPWRKLSLTRPVTLPGTAVPKLLFADPLLPEGSLPNLMRYRAWILPPPRQGSDGGCAHVARPVGSRRVEPIHVQLVSPARAAQWRVYRRLDDGPMTLVAEGLCPKDRAGLAGVVEAMDDGMSVGAARLCYFGQVADAHGNWGPLGPLGCEDVVPAELPVPLLGGPRWEGDAAHPVAVLRWFCSGEGVNRFRIVVKPLTGPVPAQGGSAQTAKIGTTILALKRPNAWFGLVASSLAGSSTEVSTEFETGPIGNAPVGEGPEFAYPLDMEAGMTYEVRVAAVDARGHAGHASYARKLVWKVEPEPVDRVVPWPQRPGVPVGRVHPSMTAVLLATNRLFWPGARDVTPVGVRVGSIPLALRESAEEVLEAGLGNVHGHRLRFATMRRAVTLGLDVEAFLFADTLSVPKRPGFRPLGVVLYREQVANDAYPEVSGDLVQVSSCLRRLAQRVYRKKDGVEQEDWVEFLDPMVGLTLEERPNEVGPLAARRVDIYLLDLHPVVRGARYRYWLVHQDTSGEPDWTMPAGEVEVPR